MVLAKQVWSPHLEAEYHFMRELTLQNCPGSMSITRLLDNLLCRKLELLLVPFVLMMSFEDHSPLRLVHAVERFTVFICLHQLILCTTCKTRTEWDSHHLTDIPKSGICYIGSFYNQQQQKKKRHLQIATLPTYLAYFNHLLSESKPKWCCILIWWCYTGLVSQNTLNHTIEQWNSIL